MSEPVAYLNGRILPASQASLKVYDAGVVLGATVTEMIRTFRHKLFRLDDHLERFDRALRYVRFDLGLSPAELAEIAETIVAQNSALVDWSDELGLIIFATAGEYATYAGGAAAASASPTLCMHTFAMPWELWAEKLMNGVHVVTPSIRHVPPICIDPKMKYRSRMHYYLADQEVRAAHKDAVALLLDLDGNVTETGGSNFLIVQKGEIVSPPLRNTLPGISRQNVIELAAKLGIPFSVRDFQPFDVVNADEAMLPSTPYCLLPATRINGVPIGNGRPGPIFDRLMAAWSEQVGFDIRRQILDGAARRRQQLDTAETVRIAAAPAGSSRP